MMNWKSIFFLLLSVIVVNELSAGKGTSNPGTSLTTVWDTTQTPTPAQAITQAVALNGDLQAAMLSQA